MLWIGQREFEVIVGFKRIVMRGEDFTGTKNCGLRAPAWRRMPWKMADKKSEKQRLTLIG
jgi:hypothetical protein